MRTGIVIVVAMSATIAHADDGVHIAAATEVPSRHLIYAEVLGKGGEYGLGYESTLMPWLSIGAAASFAVIRDQQLFTIAPYLHATLVRRRAHALYTELGAVLAHSRIASPVADWSGMSDTGSGGFASLGYEHATAHLVLRASASIAAGEGGTGPMIGFSIGWRP
jgi:hypothetical protein